MFALAVAHRLGKFSCRATLSVIRASSLNSIFSEQIQCLSEKVVTNNEFLESIEKYIPELDHADAWKASNLIATLSTAPNPGSLHDIIYMIPLNTNYLQTSAQKSSLRQDLSSSHRNPRLFQKIIAARGPNEISGFTSYGVQTVLEWARELRLSDEIWPSLCSWCATNPRWPAYEDTQTGVLIIPALAVANAYSMEAWRSLVQRYVKAFQRFHPDLYILSAVESFSKVIKLYSLVLSPTAPKEAIEAFQALNKKVVLRLQQQIKELRTEQSITFEIVDSELISILRNSALHFRRSYALQIRYIWKRLLLKLTSLTDSTYIFVLNSLLHRAHTGKDAASNLSDKTILDWGHEYLQHYMIHRVAPFNGHVFLAFVRVMGSCQHPDTTLAVFELLSVCGTNIPLRRELLKIGFSYASTSGHTQHFNIMETICPINDEIMGPHVIRRKAHLFFNTQGKMFWEHFIAHGNMADRRLMDVAFIWLEKHSKVPGKFLWCLEQAETIWIQMRQLGFHSSPLQLESLMSMYAEIGDHKGLTLYLSVGKEMITYRVLGMAMKICVLLGYSHSSHEDAKKIWSAITPHTLRAFHRDTELRKLLLQFNPSYEHDEYGYSSSQYRRIMNPRCLLRSMPTELVTCDGLRCLLPQYSVGVDFSF